MLSTQRNGNPDNISSNILKILIIKPLKYHVRGKYFLVRPTLQRDRKMLAAIYNM